MLFNLDSFGRPIQPRRRPALGPTATDMPETRHEIVEHMVHLWSSVPWDRLEGFGIVTHAAEDRQSAPDDPLPPLEDLDEGRTCDLCGAKQDTFREYLEHRRGHAED